MSVIKVPKQKNLTVTYENGNGQKRVSTHSDGKPAQWSMAFLRDDREFADFETFAARTVRPNVLMRLRAPYLANEWFILGGGRMTRSIVLSHNLC